MKAIALALVLACSESGPEETPPPIVAQQAEGAGVVLGEIKRERLAHVRRQLPALEHRVL